MKILVDILGNERQAELILCSDEDHKFYNSVSLNLEECAELREKLTNAMSALETFYTYPVKTAEERVLPPLEIPF